MNNARRFVVLAALAAGCARDPAAAQAAAAAAAGELVLTSSSPTVVADGVATTIVAARVDGAPDGVVVRFAASAGLLAADAAPLQDGVATTALYAPLEAELIGGATTIRVDATATLAVDETRAAFLDVGVVAAPQGPPVLELVSSVELAAADGTTVVELTVRALRIAPGTQVEFAADGVVVSPASAPLRDDGTATATFTAPAAPANVVVTASAAGLTADVAIAFVGADAPAYDLTGEWVQISWGAVKLSGSIALAGTQCVVAPAFHRVSVVAEGDRLVARSKTCAIEMPDVKIIDGSMSSTTVTPAFAAAIPESAADWQVDGRELGANLTLVPGSYDEVVVVGADMGQDLNGALPTESSDARVVDADGDGHPGLTVVNSYKGEQHIVTRMRTGAFTGVVVSSAEIDGSEPGALTGSSDMAILDLDFLSGALAPRTDALPSTFKLLRADGRHGADDWSLRDGVAGFTCDDADPALRDLIKQRAPAPAVAADCT